MVYEPHLFYATMGLSFKGLGIVGTRRFLGLHRDDEFFGFLIPDNH
jgi:hypothetical protein